MKTITIAPNRPLTVALADPEGQFDHETGNGLYQTTAGELLTLPRPAVVALNLVEPRPGEEIRILKSWSGKYGEPSQWTIELTARSEQARAVAGEADTLTERLEAANETPEPVKAAVEAPTPIRRPAKQPKAEPQVQPRLFDTRGTGTHGPAPAMEPLPAMPLILPAAAIARRQPPRLIPWNIAFREVSAWIAKELAANKLQWSDASQQDMVSTVLIGEMKAGRIGPWQRPQDEVRGTHE